MWFVPFYGYHTMQFALIQYFTDIRMCSILTLKCLLFLAFDSYFLVLIIIWLFLDFLILKFWFLFGQVLILTVKTQNRVLLLWLCLIMLYSYVPCLILLFLEKISNLALYRRWHFVRIQRGYMNLCVVLIMIQQMEFRH